MFSQQSQQQQGLQQSQPQNTAIANERGQQTMLSIMMNQGLMQTIDNMATLMAEGSVSTPQHFRGKKADCFAVCLQAMQWGMNPFPVMQKTHIVNGVLGYEAQLVNAVVVNSGAIKGRFSYRKFGPWERVLGKFAVRESNKDGKKSTYRVPNWTPQDEEGCGVEITAVLSSGKTESIELMLTQARTRNSTLWADDPYQQLCYLGVKRWVRLYTPDVIMGVYTIDELQEEREINPIQQDNGSSRVADMAARAEARRSAAREQQAPAQPDEAPAEYSEAEFDEETGEISLAQEVVVYIRECETLIELGQLGEEIASNKNLTDDDKAIIQQAYKKKADEIRAAG